MNKKANAQEPKIHRIALPVSDESLVIDLPDGQKLVVGKLANGSVIEVATWRGTGRPDSRTTRLMLGMSNPSTSTEGAISVAPEAIDTQAPVSSATRSPQDRAKAALAAAKKKLVAITAAIKVFKKNPQPGEALDKSEIDSDSRLRWKPATPADQTSGEADQWLEEILARAEIKTTTKKATPAKRSTKPRSTR